MQSHHAVTRKSEDKDAPSATTDKRMSHISNFVGTDPLKTITIQQGEEHIMRRAVLNLVLALAALGLASPVDAQSKPCTDADERQAERQADLLKSWDQVYRSYKKFAQCDDGAVAEGYSNAVGKLLANNWGHFPRLIKLASAHKGFEEFVVRHVDESLPGETLNKISKNARTRCPADAKALCSLIIDAASGK